MGSKLLLGLSVAAIAGCGNTGETFRSGHGQDTALSELAPADKAALCQAYEEFVEEELASSLGQLVCTLFVAATENSPEACLAAAEQCSDDDWFEDFGVEVDDIGCDELIDTSDCSATVAQFEACLNAQLAVLEAVSCQDAPLDFEILEVEPAECQEFYQACPSAWGGGGGKSPAPVSCADDADCGVGYSCEPVECNPCDEWGDCDPAPTDCVELVCVPTGECTSDLECPEYGECVDGVCIYVDQCDAIDCDPNATPVCGADGVTYWCGYLEAVCAQVDVIHEGECTGAGFCDSNGPLCEIVPPTCPEGTVPGIDDFCFTGYCIPVGQCESPGDPGGCVAEVACDAIGPACPEGMVPGIRDGCFTGYCIPADFCGRPCEELATLEECIGREDCQTVFASDCDSEGDAPCDEYEFSECVARADLP